MLNVYEELGEPSRRLILAELRKGAKSVGEICSATHLKQPNVSNHLARMRAKGIVRSARVGRNSYYSLATLEIEALVNSIQPKAEAVPAELDLESMAKTYAKAATMGDEATCTEVIDAAHEARMSLLDIYQELITPAMTLVGTWWKVRAIDEAQEHLATSITERMMVRVASMASPTGRSGKTALLGCAPNAWHVVGLRMIADLLGTHGWRTLFLGPNVPERSFLSSVSLHRPDLVLLSVASPEGVEPTVELLLQLNQLRREKVDFVLGVGGLAAQAHISRMIEAGADFVAHDIRSFAENQLPGLEQSGVPLMTEHAAESLV